MKKFITLTQLLILILFYSCSKIETSVHKLDSSNTKPSLILTKTHQNIEEEAYAILQSGNIEFVDNEYRLKLTPDEAFSAGFSREGYEFLRAQLDLANDFIKTEILERSTDKKITITDYTYYKNDNAGETVNLNPRAIEPPSKPRGTIFAILGDPKVVGVYAPHGMTRIEGHCYGTTGLIALHVVTTSFFQEITVTRIGSGLISVNIGGSNTHGNIKYSTMDSHGAIFAWQGI